MPKQIDDPSVKAGDEVVPLYEAVAVVTKIEPYRGKYTQHFTHDISYRYHRSGVRGCVSVDLREPVPQEKEQK